MSEKYQTASKNGQLYFEFARDPAHQFDFQIHRSVIVWLDFLGSRELLHGCELGTMASRRRMKEFIECINGVVGEKVDFSTYRYRVQLLSDTLVLAFPWPYQNPRRITQAFQLFHDISALQRYFIRNNFLVRRALSDGRIVEGSLVFSGSIFSFLHKNESTRAIVPRIICTDFKDEGPIQNHYKSIDETANRWMSADPAFMVDSDGWLFLDYLHGAVCSGDDSFLISHKGLIVKGARMHQHSSHILDKYRWLAWYHNYVINSVGFASRYEGNISNPRLELSISADDFPGGVFNPLSSNNSEAGSFSWNVPL